MSTSKTIYAIRRKRDGSFYSGNGYYSDRRWAMNGKLYQRLSHAKSAITGLLERKYIRSRKEVDLVEYLLVEASKQPVCNGDHHVYPPGRGPGEYV
jgi:hypothetical protein